MRNSTMATSPTMEPSVAAAITPPLDAGKQATRQQGPTVGSSGFCCVRGSLHTGDHLQVDGAAVRAGGVAGPAGVLPRHAFSEVAQSQGAVPLVCKVPPHQSANSYPQKSQRCAKTPQGVVFMSKDQRHVSVCIKHDTVEAVLSS